MRELREVWVLDLAVALRAAGVWGGLARLFGSAFLLIQANFPEGLWSLVLSLWNCLAC